MTDLTTTYLGLKLKNPLVVSASPLSAYVDNIKRMENSGAAAVVLPSLFEEQIELQSMNMGALAGTEHGDLPEALRHIPKMEGYNRGAGGYLAHIFQAKRAVSIPIIASLNGYYGGGWVQYARLIEAAGADALELNIYYLATRPEITGDEVDEMTIRLVQDVKANTTIPIAVKLSPYFSALANIASRLEAAGADGLILFNRFYQPDIDLESSSVVPSLDLSTPAELRLRLRWTAILSSFMKADLAITGGVHSAEDVVKCMLAGARVSLITSVLLAQGIEHLARLQGNLTQWLASHGHESIQSLQGRLSQARLADPAAFERANYMNVLKSLED